MTKEKKRKLEQHLLMFYTGIERVSASIHTEQLKTWIIKLNIIIK
ncbi:MAG: hypothetical protein QXM94_03145 [Thermoplasmata archaeon]